MRLPLALAAALAVLSTLAFAASEPASRLELSWQIEQPAPAEEPTAADQPASELCCQECRDCHNNGGEGYLNELGAVSKAPAQVDPAMDVWGTAAADRRWQDLRRRLASAGRHE